MRPTAIIARCDGPAPQPGRDAVAEIVKRAAAALTDLGPIRIDALRSEPVATLRLPTQGRDSIRALCDLTHHIAVALRTASVPFRRIKVSGLEAVVEIAAG